ncbi:MAG: hypothetical protein PHY43_15045 [Verrucomicrobiales bacterium]|nr:hypothetical protein [Verrucomicrobiales bacterium]
MNTRLLLRMVVFIIAGAASSALADGTQIVPPAGDVSAFKAATNIVFTRFMHEKGKEERFVVSEPKEVAKLLSSISLKQGTPLRDMHEHGARFQGPSGEIIVSVCPRCFTVHAADGSRVQTYEMPREFYAAFRKLARQHGWTVERK